MYIYIFKFVRKNTIDIPNILDQNFVLAERMTFQVMFVIKVHVAYDTSVSWHLAALVSSVPSQRVLVLVPFTAIVAHPKLFCNREKHKK